ncbi:hypothetical protein RM780_11870 [Streptomyces sp. DSM 44917]|uniref:Uncharacterized protein n=1 Tax=Streptomyces boetiae TaxID=3075541 RepID=A0ABU2L8I7_9ACTN|nr:hypothetical protein [Streptomyces sp. DSM 44917]MDT0307657.1 hypothetical protein [Streptomyces sp. DSM 44917]
MVVTDTALREDDALGTWLARAAPAAGASKRWPDEPAASRRLRCGVIFDAVVCAQPLIEVAYWLLEGYEQQLGPAVAYPAHRVGAILVPIGIEERWQELVTASEWPARQPRPLCLGSPHTIEVPPAVPDPAAGARWLRDPEVSLVSPPVLTSPVQLARCLTEALSLGAKATGEYPLLPAAHGDG